MPRARSNPCPWKNRPCSPLRSARFRESLVSFHKNGTINRVFPLNGKLSGYWSQEDEAALAKPVTLTTPIGPVRVKVLSVSFYDDRSLRSLTLWPGETLSVPTPVGPIEGALSGSASPATARSAPWNRPNPPPCPPGRAR